MFGRWQVLTTGSWPTQTASKCNLPRELERCCEDFREFYLQNHSGRKLNWQTNMGNADLKANFGARKHELNVSTYQMCILLLFNEADSLSYREIQAQTNILAGDLKRSLQSLACVKVSTLGRSAERVLGYSSACGSSHCRQCTNCQRQIAPLSRIWGCTHGKQNSNCQQQLAPLSHGMLRAVEQGKNVLRKDPMSKDIAEADMFSFNEGFSSKFYKVKIGTVSAQKESEPEKQETRHKVEEDRKPQVCSSLALSHRRRAWVKR